ncbi:MAG: YbhN family protein [Faecousia sp.]
MNKKQWKTVVVSVVTLALLSLLVFWVFRDHYQEILQNIRAVSVESLLFLTSMSVLYEMLESAICFTLVHRRLPNFSLWQATEVVFLGVFGNVSTLSVGSVPMQSYYLHRCGLMAGSGVGMMTLEYVLHKSSVLIYATVMLLLQGRWLDDCGISLPHYMMLGYGICAVIIAVLILACTWEKVQRLAAWLIDHFPDTGKWSIRKRLWKENLDSLSQESRQLLHDRPCIRKVLALNGLKLFCLYSIPYLAMKILGISSPSFWHVQMLAALMFLISNALPNVAGVGPVEFAFIMIFSNYMEYAQASSALILYRIATFFFPFLLSIFIFLHVQKRILDDSQGT